MDLPPLLANKHTDSPSVFIPSTLLREARRQKGIAAVPVPPVCVLDPDGDLVRRLPIQAPRSVFPDWPCYHTELDAFLLGGRQAGIVGRPGRKAFSASKWKLRRFMLRARESTSRCFVLPM